MYSVPKKYRLNLSIEGTVIVIVSEEMGNGLKINLMVTI